MLRVTVLASGGTRAGLTPPAGFTRWRREREDAREREKNKVTQPLGWGEEGRSPPWRAHTWEGVRQGQKDKDKMGTLTFSKSCASWDLSLLCTVWLSKSIISTPILQMRKRRLDPSLPAMKLTCQGHHTAALLEQMRCESSLQTLLSVSRVVATKGTPEEWESPREQFSGDPRRQSCASIQKLSLLRTLEKISFMPWEECMPLANAETARKEGSILFKVTQ